MLIHLVFPILYWWFGAPVTHISEPATHTHTPNILILGTLQDAGSPHIGCTKACCAALFNQPDTGRKVVCLGLIDPEARQTFLVEATPDLPTQAKMLKTRAGLHTRELPDGIFLTHAHIGHYAGLMYLGREAIGAKEVPVYAMPRMKAFLEENGPWSQLVSLHNIQLRPLQENEPVQLTKNLRITPFRVPHRDEYSETVGYRIEGPNKTAIFIPDIDKWEKWQRSIIEAIQSVDYAFVDATFFDGAEINNRDISEIPHPFVVESMRLFADLPASDKAKVHFIHFNHTNPLLDADSDQTRKVLAQGFRIASMGMEVGL